MRRERECVSSGACAHAAAKAVWGASEGRHGRAFSDLSEWKQADVGKRCANRQNIICAIIARARACAFGWVCAKAEKRSVATERHVREGVRPFSSLRSRLAPTPLPYAATGMTLRHFYGCFLVVAAVLNADWAVSLCQIFWAPVRE